MSLFKRGIYLNLFPKQELDKPMKNVKSFATLLAFLLVSVYSSAQVLTPPTVVGDLSICLGGSVSLSATDANGDPSLTYRWYSKNLLFYTPLDTADEVVYGPLLLSGDYGVSVYDPATNNESSITDFTVVVDLLSTHIDAITTTPADLVVCAGEGTTITANGTLGSVNYRWYDALVDGTLLFEGATYNTGPLSVAPLLFVSGIDNAGCESARTPVVTPVVVPALSLPITGVSSPLICSGDSVEMYTTNKPAGNSVNWYTSLLGGSPVFTGDTLRLEEENTSGANLTINYYAEFEDADGCRSLRTLAFTVVLPALDAPIVDNPIQLICDGESATFNASSALGGAVFHWYDAPLGGNRLFTGPTFNSGAISNTSGTNAIVNFYVSVEDGNGCESLRLPVTITVVPAIDAPIVLPNVQTSCPGDSVTFSATSLLGNATFRWYDAAIGGNLLHTGADFNTGPLANPGPGNVTVNFYVEVEDANGCISPRNFASVIILPALAAPLYDPINPLICNGDSVTFTASSLPTDLPQYNWYDSFSATAPIHTGASFNTGPITNSTGTNVVETYFLEGVNDDGCRTARIPVTATILPALDLPIVANSPAVICSGESFTFNASSLLGVGVTYYWYDSPLGGTLLFQGENFNTGPVSNTSGTDAVQTFWVELEDVNGCRSLRAPAVLTIRPALDLPIANPPLQLICNDDSATFIGTSLLDTVQEYYWYDALVGGNLLFTGDTFTTPPLGNSSQSNASLTVYLELEDTAGCRSLRTPATVIVAPAVDIPIVDNPAQVICNGSSATFVATSLLGADDFRWYDALVGGNLLFQGDTFNTGPLNNPNAVDLLRTFYVEAVDSNGCSSVRLPVLVTLRPNLDLPVVIPPASIVCNGESATFVATSVGNLLGQPVTFRWYDNIIGGSELFEGDTFVTPPFVNNSGADLTATYFVEVADSNDCRSLRTPVIVTVRPALDLPLVSPPVQVICASDSAEFVASSVLGSAQEFYWYDAIVGGNEIFVGDTFRTGAINNGTGADITRIFYVELEDTAGCRSLRVPATLIVRPSLAVALVNPPLSIVCEGESVSLVATSLFEAEYHWYDSLNGSTLLFVGDTFTSGPLSNVSGTDLDTIFYVEAVDTAGCISAVRSFGTVIIRPALNLALVDPLVDTICSGGEAEFVASPLVPGSNVTFYWYNFQTGGNPIFVGDTFRTTINSNGSTANLQRTFYVEVEDSTGCRSVRTPAIAIVTPSLNLPIVDPAIQQICSGTRATISASAMDTSGADFFWFDDANSTTPIFQGKVFVTDTLNNVSGSDVTQDFYVELRDTTGEGCVSQRAVATVIVTSSPDAPTIENPFNTICSGESVDIIASSDSDIPGAIYWYESADTVNHIFVGDTFSTGPLDNNGSVAANYDYYAEYRDSLGCRSLRSVAFVTVRPFLDAPSASPANQTVCAGGDADVAGSSANPSAVTFNWYDVQSGGSPFATGDSITIENIPNNTNTQQVYTYYVESVDSAGCKSPRTPFFVTVQAPSQKPTVDPADPRICTESSATLTANSDFGDDGTYYWYDEPQDANPVFVGRTFETPVYYNFDGSLVQHDFYVAVEDTVGCVSGLAAVVVTVEPSADDVLGVQVNNPTCHGDQAILRAISDLGYTDFRWFRNQTDLTPVATGETLVTAPLFNDTVLFLSTYSPDGCSSVREPVQVNTLEVITLGQPTVDCDDQNDGNQVKFVWDAIANAEFYSVSEDNGVTWKSPNGNLEHTVLRSSDNQTEATLLVRAGQTPTACSDEFGPVSVQIACAFGNFLPDQTPFNAFSPNNDGKNDVWYIQDGLEDFPDNEVIVFNRWGSEVFRTKGYDNDKNVFTGEGLEDGAYFYIISVPSINVKRTGYVMIIR